MSMQRQSGRPLRLSVVVAATEVPALEETLVSVLENRPDACEVIVAVGMPYADPWNVGEEAVSFVEAANGSGLVGCVTAGVAAATGDVIHVLAAGWKATAGWTDAAVRHFERPGVAAVVPLAVSETDHGQPVSAGVRRTAGGRSVTVVPRRLRDGIATGVLPAAPMLEAGFWRGDVIRQIGFSAACGDALAAADMAAALTASRAAVVLEPEARVVSGPARKRRTPFMAGFHSERLFWRSLACESTIPAILAHAGEVLRHAAATAPLGTLGMLAGRVAAAMQIGSCVGRARQLRDLMREAAARDASAGEALTYRIDGPHESQATPHVDPSTAPLRRSA